MDLAMYHCFLSPSILVSSCISTSSPVLYFFVLYSPVLYFPLLYSPLLYFPLLHSLVLYFSLLYSHVLYFPLQYSPLLYFPLLYSHVFYFPLLYSSVLYPTTLSQSGVKSDQWHGLLAHSSLLTPPSFTHQSWSWTFCISNT